MTQSGASLRDRACALRAEPISVVSGTAASPLRVLVACERSGVVRRAFRARGHNAWSCDLEPADDGSQFHIQGDAIAAAYRTATSGRSMWDLLIGFPECTFLANSSAKHLYAGMKAENGPNPERWYRMGEAAIFFRLLWDAPVEHIALENPIMLGYPQRLSGIPEPTQIIQPWQFGHGETKATCLRLKRLPPLRPTNIVDGRNPRVWRMGPGPDRKRDRSRTLPGIGEAMADQWGAAIADGRRMAETENTGSVRSTTSGGAVRQSPNPRIP